MFRYLFWGFVCGAIIGGASYLPHAHADSTDALVLGPTGYATPDAAYLAAADSLYLHMPIADVSALTTPETGDFGPSVTAGEADLIAAVNADYASGTMSAADPLTVMGYSQSAVIAGLAEQTFAQEGIPTQDLHFVLVGDTASAEGGMLNDFVNMLPPEYADIVTQYMDANGMGYLIGATTPDNLYPTDVYTIQGDGWSDFTPNIVQDFDGMIFTHQEYLGLTATEIADASVTVDGLTNYFTITAPDMFDALVAAVAATA